MPQTACSSTLFELNTPLFFSKKDIPVNFVASYRLLNTGRPFIPIVGAILDANGVFIPDTIANNQAFVDMFYQFFKSCRQASINYYNDLVGTASIEPAGGDRFAGYLAKKTLADIQQANRFFQVSGIVTDFWNNANPAWTNAEYNTNLQKLFEDVQLQADKNLYIPPAQYLFQDLDPFSVVFDAYGVAVPARVGFLAVEYYQ